METRLSNILKTTNVTNLANVIQEKASRVPQVVKQFVYFLKAVERCPTFDIQTDINLAIFWIKFQNFTV